MKHAILFEITGIVAHELWKRAGWRDTVPRGERGPFGRMLDDHEIIVTMKTDADVNFFYAKPDTDERITAILLALEQASDDPSRLDDAYRMMVEAGYP